MLTVGLRSRVSGTDSNSAGWESPTLPRIWCGEAAGDASCIFQSYLALLFSGTTPSPLGRYSDHCHLALRYKRQGSSCLRASQELFSLDLAAADWAAAL